MPMYTKKTGLFKALFILSFAIICFYGPVSQPISPSASLISKLKHKIKSSKLKNRYLPDPRKVTDCRDRLNESFYWAFNNYPGEIQQIRILFQKDARVAFEVIPINPKDFSIENYAELKSLVLKYRKKNLQHVEGLWFIVSTPQGVRQVSIMFDHEYLHTCLSWVYLSPEMIRKD